MVQAPGQAPADSDDFAARLRPAVAEANIPTLLMVLVQMTGDRRWLEQPFRPGKNRGLDDNDTGGLDPDVQARVRDAAFDAILAWHGGKPLAIPAPSREMLVEMLSVAMGEPVPIGYADLIVHELGLDGQADDAARPAPAPVPEPVPEPEPEPPEGFRAVIIGAGASGLCAAVNLQKAGVPYTIVERNAEIGGVWFENRYPGAGVDTPSHLYCFSFARNDWTRYFADQQELRRYFNRVADDFGIREHIDFGTEVVSAVYDEAAREWELELRRADGRTDSIRANLVISAVGAFNKPKWPDIEGLDRFEGPVAHTARWPDGLELDGKRVAVIGNGASAMQLVPAVADRVRSLTVFQRSPQWAAPFEQFQKRIPEGVRWLFATVPLYQAWYRLRLAWTFNDRIYDALQKDPDWPHPERAINEVNDAHRRYFTRHIVSELGDRQDLLDEVLPKYPPFGKRMLLDNGWFRTLTREDVTLVTDRIARIGRDRVVTEGGAEHEVDVIVIATGFDVVRFLAPMKVVGRGGATLEELWQGDDARAYLGTAVPGFPNFFCLYGPNTQFGHGGSLIFMLELQMHYVMDVIRQMFAEGLDAVECRQEVHDAYNDRVDRAHDNMVWTHPGMDVYYRNSRGRVVVNNPFKIVDYWHFVQQAALDDYVTVPVRPEAGRPRAAAAGGNG